MGLYNRRSRNVCRNTWRKKTISYREVTCQLQWRFICLLKIALISSFAMIINKSQNQSFNFVCVDFTDQVFSHAQVYGADLQFKSVENNKFLWSYEKRYDFKEY